jgi:hypothetical protein
MNIITADIISSLCLSIPYHNTNIKAMQTFEMEAVLDSNGPLE